jgi:two-component system, cell cycle sensor histidine kinase and response regulator CckA
MDPVDRNRKNRRHFRWGLIATLLLLAGGRAQAQRLRIAYGDSYPMHYLDAAGKARGFAVDVVNEAARREGLSTEWLPPSQRSTGEMLRDGTADLLAAATSTPERRRLFYVSDPWWEAEMVALVPAGSPIQNESGLAGRRLAANAASNMAVVNLNPSDLVDSADAPAAAEYVCTGRAEGAVIAAVFLRELLAGMPAACRAMNWRTIDLSHPRQYVIVARPEMADAARRLRARIDGMTADGTLTRLASLHPPISTRYAARRAEMSRARFERDLSRAGTATAGLLVLVVIAFVIRIQRSGRRFQSANADLRVSIQERDEALEALRLSEQRLRTMMETTFDWIWEVDAEGRYTFASPKVTNLLGYSPAEVLGRTPFDLMPPREAERVRAEFLAIAADRRAFTGLENANLHKNGGLVVLESTGVPVFGPGGELAGYRGLERDITERKRLEQCQGAQAAVSRALAGSTVLAEAVPSVVAALSGIGREEFGGAWQVDSATGRLSCVGVWSTQAEPAGATPAGKPDEAAFHADPLAETIQLGGRPQALRLDAWSVRSPLADWMLAAGQRRAVGVPLLSGDRTIGAIILFGRDDNQLDDRFLETLASIGRQIGEFLERGRAREEVRRFVAASPAVLYALNVEGDDAVPTFVSENIRRLTGHEPKEALRPGWWLENIHPDDRDRVVAESAAPYELDQQVLEFRFRRKDGAYLWLLDEKRLLRDTHGRPAEIVGAWSDISRRVQLEQQLLQAQKMEAIGVLAGGVAHDFNNLLTVINGYSALALRTLPPDSPSHRHIEEILKACERGGGLTRQLLIFSRQQELQPRVICLDEIVRGMEKMLRRVIGEDVELSIRAPGKATIVADPGQMEQVLMNLVVNARDAMPRGGALTIAVNTQSLQTGASGIPPGNYAELTVTDTGSGIEPAVLGRIFEPFFTTKDQGKGTGLGLSTVYGIVRQSNGYLEVDSCPGLGSTFRVLIPVTAAEPGPPEIASLADDWNGTETILLVEDEPAVRSLAGEALRSRGYRVLEAANAGEAILIGESSEARELDLLLTDVVMPRVNGYDLADRLLRGRPGTGVLFMTGYVDRDLQHQAPLAVGAECLQKPFTPSELARKVRQTLDGMARARAR